jgi:hypothetical protein
MNRKAATLYSSTSRVILPFYTDDRYQPDFERLERHVFQIEGIAIVRIMKLFIMRRREKNILNVRCIPWLIKHLQGENTAFAIQVKTFI